MKNAAVKNPASNHLPFRGDADNVGKVFGAQFGVDVADNHFNGVDRKAAAGGDFRAGKAVGKIGENVGLPWGNVNAYGAWHRTAPAANAINCLERKYNCPLYQNNSDKYSFY